MSESPISTETNIVSFAGSEPENKKKEGITSLEIQNLDASCQPSLVSNDGHGERPVVRFEAREEAPSNRPVVTPGAYHQPGFGTADGVDGEPSEVSDHAEGEPLEAEVGALPVAEPLSAELVKDGWLHNTRNRYLLVGGLLLLGLVLGLAIGLSNGDERKSAPSAAPGVETGSAFDAAAAPPAQTQPPTTPNSNPEPTRQPTSCQNLNSRATRLVWI